jgi:hypothetical protein
MKQDKALIKALNLKENPKLPTGFNAQLMGKIYIASAKQKKRNTIISYTFISFVSLGLIGMAVYLLKNYLTFSSMLQIPQFIFTSESKSFFGFSIYIASLVLILVFMDGYFRRLRERHLNKKVND